MLEILGEACLAEHGGSNRNGLAELAESADGRVAALACNALLDRGYGKPMQALLELKAPTWSEEMETVDEILRKIELLRRGGETIEGEAVPLRALANQSNGSGNGAG